jgi:diaminohydroxyphosphoribosylaminopyrimidine deaminase/5-amino-6-(5-phosphoribosylamino)uracil reductase
MVMQTNLIDFAFILLSGSSPQLETHETYMRRCLELALRGAGNVAPNPMVGALLVHEGEIIGEGYHRVYGGPHAEVNCVDAVPESKRHLIRKSTMYVSLEPCAHFGKTPPCADMIIRNKIPKVVIGCRDPFVEVNGKGIEKLQNAGVEVISGVLEQECKALNKRFFTFHTLHRPYIILKWAQTANHFIGNFGNARLHITNELTNRLVHKWRSEEAAIMVGTNTALMDDPKLNNRLWTGHSPVRVVIDKDLQLPSTLHLFDGSVRTVVFNLLRHEEQGNPQYYQVTDDVSLVHQVVNGLHYLKLNSVIIEGGAQLIQSFIDEGVWDEARVITNGALQIKEGVRAPQLRVQELFHQESIGDDEISYFRRR